MLSQDIIQNRIKNFWGYGSLESPVWLVGMEERFDSSRLGEYELEKQFNYTKENSINGMLDVKRSDMSKWKELSNLSPFLKYAELQKTWKLPIYLYLYLKNSNKDIITNINVLNFQINILCDSSINEASTIELSPLPAFSTNEWTYGKYGIFEMETRNKYYKNFLPERAERIKELVNKYKPKLVIFYSSNQKTHLPRWVQIIGKIPELISNPENRLSMYFANNGNTSFCIIPQPTAGVSYSELNEYAEKIKERIKF